MNSFEIFYIIGSVIGFIAQAIILIAAAIYYFKTGSIGGILLLIGSLLSIISVISKPLITAAVASKMGAEFLVTAQGMYSIADGVFGLVFAIGFVMTVIRELKMLKTGHSQKKSN